MDDTIVGLGMLVAIAAVIGFFFLRSRKTKPREAAASGDPGGDGRGWDYGDGGGGADGGD